MNHLFYQYFNIYCDYSILIYQNKKFADIIIPNYGGGFIEESDNKSGKSFKLIFRK